MLLIPNNPNNRNSELIGHGAGLGIARQPEAVGDIKGNAIILAALVEGPAFFAIVISLLFAIK